ncbi:Nitroreductase [Paracoccus isoporae]|uniref:Putative NAD(P)H nitroreductase n=1 Tax=Paracoccus isoporae TaxID=591205 RepID=A0A1G6ST47_9RHOB|nr:nitroreductase family protein [Paracoccus isoporae]SDD20013.1 Nitroreductase [Paracoccus isoporae]
MTQANPAALEFLRRRRSHPPALLGGPGPTAEELEDLLTIAARVPDHGKLEPWRFIVMRGAALEKLAPLVETASAEAGNPPEKAAKHGNAMRVPVVVAVVSAPVEGAKVPEWEQVLSAGAVCLSLLNAALAAGFGASWLTGMASHRDFARTHLGVAEGEQVVGLIHIGSAGSSAPPERPRPDIAAKTTVLE